MAITLSSIQARVRYLIGDNSSTDTDPFTYTNSNVFILTESNVIAVIRAYLNNVEMGDSELIYDSSTNTVTVNLTMISGDTVQIEYSFYPNLSNNEIQNYVRASLIHISASGVGSFRVEDDTIYPTPNLKMQNLIAMITSLLIQPDNKSYSLPEVRITVPKDLPTHEKIRRTISIFKHDKHGIFDVL